MYSDFTEQTNVAAAGNRIYPLYRNITFSVFRSRLYTFSFSLHSRWIFEWDNIYIYLYISTQEEKPARADSIYKIDLGAIFE